MKFMLESEGDYMKLLDQLCKVSIMYFITLAGDLFYSSL